MYQEFFGLDDLPFAIVPDPDFLYRSAQHKEALAHLVFGLQDHAGFTLLTGEIGTGKTTLCRAVLTALPENIDVALVLNPTLSPRELLETLCDEFSIKREPGALSNKDLVDMLNDYLLDAHGRGRSTVVILDEAQNLGVEVLEQLRLLTNLETSRTKLLRIFLVGQPELRELLDSERLRQLSQRITARYHLGSLSREETRSYVEHRLQVAGAERALFTASALAELHRSTAGTPRKINILADRALLGAYLKNATLVDRDIVQRAARELAGKKPRRFNPDLAPWALPATTGVVAIVTTGVLLAWWSSYMPPTHLAETPRVLPLPTVGETAEPPRPPTSISPAAESAALPPEPDQPAPTIANPLELAHAARTAAQSTLLEAWSLMTPTGGQDMCESARLHGLRCLEGFGSLMDLRRLNRPALLSVRKPNGKPGYLVVSELTADTATLLVDHAEPLELPTRDLVRRWTGEFTLLWKPPLEDTDVITAESGPEAVAWLRRTMAKVQPVPRLTDTGASYDWPLTKAVMEFQRRSGITVDGTVGAATFIALNNETATGIPVISQDILN